MEMKSENGYVIQIYKYARWQIRVYRYNYIYGSYSVWMLIK